MNKKNFFIASALLLSIVCHAQLLVESDGVVGIGKSLPIFERSLIRCGITDNICRFGTRQTTHSRTKDVCGCENIATSWGLNYSVASYNEAINLNGLCSIGVVGKTPDYYRILPHFTGFNAAIYGIANDSISEYINLPLGQGSYAGYFIGDTYVDGVLTATSLYTPSDMRLKENVEPLDLSERGGSILDNVLDMNVIQYNYKDKDYKKLELDGDCSEEMKEIVKEYEKMKEGYTPEAERQKDLHFGLSAQELQEIFPNLVREGQDGYLGVNYTELVPVLICCIQELKQELDEVKGTDMQMRTKTNAPVGETTTVKATTVGRNQLYQNTPNPFKEQTVIRFSLADDVKNATVCIFDMQGKMLQTYPVQAGMESITVNGYELGAGMFLYSLVVNGQEVDTKKMILSK